MHSLLKSLALGLLASAPLVAGHCKISAVTGDLGGKGTGLGIDPTVDPNSQSDVTVFQGSQAKSFGETPAGGNINPATALTAMIADTGATLPQVSVGGTVKLTVHQVNADGAGPFTCSVDPTAQGTSFQSMTITTNVAGNNGVSNAANQDFPLTAVMPAGVTCTGTVAGQSNLCMVRCQNPTGPFGGVVPVQMGAGSGSGNAGSSSTTVATTTSTTTAAAKTTTTAATTTTLATTTTTSSAAETTTTTTSAATTTAATEDTATTTTSSAAAAETTAAADDSGEANTCPPDNTEQRVAPEEHKHHKHHAAGNPAGARMFVRDLEEQS